MKFSMSYTLIVMIFLSYRNIFYNIFCDNHTYVALQLKFRVLMSQTSDTTFLLPCWAVDTTKLPCDAFNSVAAGLNDGCPGHFHFDLVLPMKLPRSACPALSLARFDCSPLIRQGAQHCESACSNMSSSWFIRTELLATATCKKKERKDMTAPSAIQSWIRCTPLEDRGII